MLVFLVAGKTPYKSCGSASGKLLNVTVSGCTGNPCILKKGTDASFAIGFTAGKDITAVKAVVHGIISGIPIPFPIPNADGCKNSNLVCPLKSGQTYLYKDAIPVAASYPSIRLVVKWELEDENGKDIVCIEVPAQIE